MGVLFQSKFLERRAWCVPCSDPHFRSLPICGFLCPFFSSFSFHLILLIRPVFCLYRSMTQHNEERYRKKGSSLFCLIKFFRFKGLNGLSVFTLLSFFEQIPFRYGSIGSCSSIFFIGIIKISLVSHPISSLFTSNPWYSGKYSLSQPNGQFSRSFLFCNRKLFKASAMVTSSNGNFHVSRIQKWRVWTTLAINRQNRQLEWHGNV